MALELNSDFALLYGIMLGDGCLSKCDRHKIISITGSSDDDLPFFENVINPIIFNLINRKINIKFRKKYRAIDFGFSSCELFDFIHSFGYPIGKKGNKLFIPNIFYEKDLVKYIIQGFFATDGSLVITNNNGTIYPRIEANGIAKILIKEISDWINNQGIKCNIYDAKRNKISPGSYLSRQPQSRLQINGKDNLKKFIEKIGFVNPKQIERLKSYYGYTEN